MNLANWFQEGGYVDKADIFSDDLEMAISEEWTKGDDSGNPTAMFPQLLPNGICS